MDQFDAFVFDLWKTLKKWFRLQCKQLKFKLATPQVVSALRPCLCAVRPFVLTFTGSLDEELRWIQTKGREMSEMRDLDHSHDVDDLDEGIIALPQSLHQFRRSVLGAVPHSDRHFFSMRRKAQTAGTCAEIGFMGCVETALTHGLGHGWSINRSRSIGWSLLQNPSWLLTTWKQVGSWGGKRVNIPRPWKYLFNNFAKPVKPKLRVPSQPQT